MPEDTERKDTKQRSSPRMGGSLGPLPTENLLQMVGNLRLSTRLLLEKQDTKDFTLLTFREGELIPEIESSRYPLLQDVLSEDPEVNREQVAELAGAPADLPFWNRLLVAGVVDRDKLKHYLVEGVRQTLSTFHDLSGIHFELAPMPSERLGTYPGFSVTEICALSHKPESVPEPEPKPPSQPEQTGKDSPRFEASLINTGSEEEKAPSTKTENQLLTDLLRQLRDVVPGAFACYLMNYREKKLLASSSALKMDDRPDFQAIKDVACAQNRPEAAGTLKVHEFYFVTDEYLVGINYLSPTCCLFAICRGNTQFGLLLTGLRKAAQKAAEFAEGICT